VIFVKRVVVAVAVAVLSGVGYGQHEKPPGTSDTLRTGHIIVVDPGLSTGKSTLLLPPALQWEGTPDDTSLFSIWKQTAIKPPLIGGMLEPKADLTATLRAQWARDSELQTLRSVLGTVQLGGVAYLAYRALTSPTPKPVKKH
jgi:hypothetical protein